MNPSKWCVWILALVFLVAAPASADVTLPKVIGNNMVLQRGEVIFIWGRADADEKIEVRLGENNASTRADEKGRWTAKLPPMPAGGPHVLVVKGKNEVRLDNILVGEVWICSGQSNMEWPLSQTENAEEEISRANFPNLRLFDVPRATSGQPLFDVNAEWRPCTSDTVPHFSAVSFYFGRVIQEELKVPVGLISTAWGGTRIEPWTPPKGFDSVEKLKVIAEVIDKADREYREAIRGALDPFAAWLKSARRALEKGERLPPKPYLPRHALDRHDQPTGLYNAMVHPLVPFAFRGALWYQGEANRTDGMMYHEKMKALIRGWRKVWDQGDFPFYYVQLAPFRYRDDPYHLAKVREAQLATLGVPNTGMAVTMDIGNLDDIHPRNKKDVGKRLALWALAKDYGRRGMVYSGPLYKTMTLEGNKIRIRFDHAGSGLASLDGKPLTCFEIAGADKEFRKARAAIDGDTVLVWADAVDEPAAVRFGWHQEAQPNLMNKEGLPASPFRSNSW